MLSMNNYTQEYIDKCRLKVDSQLSTYRNLVTTAREQAGADNPLLNNAIESFEPPRLF
jgi:hypothetical protein